MKSIEHYQSRLSTLRCWEGDITWSRLHGGFSAITYKVTDQGGSYVARFGEDAPIHQVYRVTEQRLSRAAAELGISPLVTLSEPDVLVLKFIEGHLYTQFDMRRGAARLGRLLARIHREMPSMVGDVGRRFDVFEINRRYYARLVEGAHFRSDKVERYLEFLAMIEPALVPLPKVLGHHDLLPGNIIEDHRQIWIIDWEYGGYGHPLFDLANLSTNGSFCEEEDEQLLTSYFEATPSDETRHSFEAMRIASLLREALWGLVSKYYIRNTEVDYDTHLTEYMLRLDRAFTDFQHRHAAPCAG